MKHFPISVILTLAILSSIVSASSLVPQKTSTVTYQFLQTAGKKEDTAVSKISLKDDRVFIYYSDTKGNSTVAECLPDYNTISWHFTNTKNHTDVIIVRKKCELHVKGTLKKRYIKRVLKIDSLPWFQVLEFSLPSYAKKITSENRFWVMRPTDFSVHKMRLQKKSDNESATHELKLSMSPCGVPEQFWKATMTVSAESGRFIRSKLPSFFPGRAPVIQTLLNCSDLNLLD